MTSNQDKDRREERMERAGRYVLGLMEDAERTRAETDMEVDAEFRNDVLRFAQQMHALDDTATPSTVSAEMWQSVVRRIADMPQMANAPLPPVPPAAAEVANTLPDDLAAARALREERRARSPRTSWQGGLLAASILAACGLGFMLGRFTLPAEAPVVVVVLSDENASPGAVVEAYGDDRVRIIPLEDFAVPQGKVLQAWTLYDRQVGPVSLGTFELASEISLTQPGNLPVPVADQLYEITLEDAPGSNAGRPLGPILVKGLAKRPAGT